MKRTTIFPPERVTIVGILNATPDSFSDGGRFVRARARVDLAAVLEVAAGLIEEGAHVLDVGGESTRPGAVQVPVELEIARTAPVIEALCKRFDTPLSIDTRKAEVADAALEAGASWVNDVSGPGPDPVLGVVAREGNQPPADEIIDLLRPHFANWQLPDEVIPLAEIPHTATGKISKLKLRQVLDEMGYRLPDQRGAG